MKYSLIALIIGFCFITVSGCLSEPKPVITQPTAINIPVALVLPIVQECPIDMIHVVGKYCSQLEERVCVKKTFDKKLCLEFSNKPIKCLGFEKEVDFCIDKEEFTSVVGDLIPIHNITYTEAEQMCTNVGKRMCMDFEWTQACEGPEHLPFAQGYVKGNVCNTGIGIKKLVVNKKLMDFTAPIDEFPECLSYYGVHNMSGNVDEWVRKSWGSKPNRSGLKGGYFGGSRNMCRPMTHLHAEYYSDIQTGFRCCSNTNQ